MGSMNEDDWFKGNPLPGITLAYNSIAQIISGEHAGETGWLVAVEPGPDPIYTVELRSGDGDVDVPQSNSFLRQLT
jgi:hypothetical protein